MVIWALIRLDDLNVRALDTYNADYMLQANDEINLAGEHFFKLISMIEQ